MLIQTADNSSNSCETVVTDEMGKINWGWMFGANERMAVAGTTEVGKKEIIGMAETMRCPFSHPGGTRAGGDDSEELKRPGCGRVVPLGRRRPWGAPG